MINVLKGSLLGLSLGVLLNASVSYAYPQSSSLYLAADEPASTDAGKSTDTGKSEETAPSTKEDDGASKKPVKKVKGKVKKGKKGKKKKK